MKLLYLCSEHPTLAYDDLTLFTEMGIDWFSTGIYKDPLHPEGISGSFTRPPIFKEVDDNLIDQFNKLNPNKKLLQHCKISKAFVDNFDLVLVNHISPAPMNLLNNWSNIKHKPVIWRTYCQQQPHVERLMKPCKKQGLKVVRVSANEQNILNALPHDAVIRAYVDTNRFKNWHGSLRQCVTFNNFYARRSAVSNTNEYEKVITGLNCKLYGGDSDGHPRVLGVLSPEDQLIQYQSSRVYFALGSKPAALTYNLVEAMSVGCPVVTWGPNLGNFRGTAWDGTYEASDLIERDVNGFWSDDLGELREFIVHMFKDHERAKELGAAGRQTILREFSKEKVKQDWLNFFKSL